MVSVLKNSVHVVTRPKAFGPTKQAFEIKNDSEKEVTVFLERLGSEHFRVSNSCQKLTMKPGASARAQVEFCAPEKGFVITLSAIFKAVINVWALEQGKGVKKELVDILNVTATGPGFVSLDNLHCFDPAGSSKEHQTGRRAG